MVNRSFFYGEGLFETILYRGRTTKLLRHYRRLSESAKYFHMPCPDFETFCVKIEEKTKGRKDLYVKVCLLSYGKPRYYEMPQKAELKVFVYRYLPKLDSVRVCVSPFLRHSSDPIARHKTLNYLFNIMVKRQAMQQGYYDGLILNETGHITECSSANLLIVKKGTIYTPHRNSGLLFGTTLQSLMEKVKVEETQLTLKDLFDADHIFLANSLIGALPVSKVEDTNFKIDHELTKYLQEVLQEENTI
jgi:4-amino-4-deoxychorismate lyase